MNWRAIAVFLWSCLIATAAVAGEEHETKIVIKTDGGEDGAFEWVSHDPDADFSDLEVGESQTIKGDDGREVTVTRNEKGLEFDIEGKKIEMPHFGDDDVHVRKAHRVKIIEGESTDGVTIISTGEIDDETRARIENVLKEAGAEGDVMFIDGSELHGDEQAGVHVIKKKKVEIDVEVEKD